MISSGILWSIISKEDISEASSLDQYTSNASDAGEDKTLLGDVKKLALWTASRDQRQTQLARGCRRRRPFQKGKGQLSPPQSPHITLLQVQRVSPPTRFVVMKMGIAIQGCSLALHVSFFLLSALGNLKTQQIGRWSSQPQQQQQQQHLYVKITSSKKISWINRCHGGLPGSNY